MANEPSAADSLKAALADIQQPALPDEFYLAPGYLLLALLLFAGAAWIYRFLLKRYRRNQARRLALRQLNTITAEQKDAANRVLLLLKQYIQTKKPGHPALTMQSSDFVAFLQKTAQLEQPALDLELLLYGPTPSAAAVNAWLELARMWLVHHREVALYV